MHVATPLDDSAASSVSSTSSSAGHFVIRDLTEGKGLFHVRCCSDRMSSQITMKVREDTPPSTSCRLTSQGSDGMSTPLLSGRFVTIASAGVRFVAGKLGFSLTALPPEQLSTLRMFDAVKQGNLEELRSILESGKCAERVIPYVSVSCVDENVNLDSRGSDSPKAKRLSLVSVATHQGVDVNVEYQAPVYDDEHFFGAGSNQRSSVRGVSLASPVSGPSCHQGSREHRLLLHVAIEKNNLEMIGYLLSERADVRRYQSIEINY